MPPALGVRLTGPGDSSRPAAVARPPAAPRGPPPDDRPPGGQADRGLLRSLADLPAVPSSLRVAEAEGGLACLVQVWPAGTLMPAVAVERRRVSGARARCRADVLDVVRRAGRALTRKEVIRGLRADGLTHGPGTISKALADLTAAGELVNPRDKRGYRMPDWPQRPSTRSLF